MKRILINCTLIIALLIIAPNLIIAQTTMTFKENYDGSTTVKNEYGTVIGYIKNDPYNNDSYLVYDRYGNVKARISKNRRFLRTDPILLTAFRQSAKPLDLSSVDYDKVDKSFDKLNRSIQESNKQYREFAMQHPEAYKRLLQERYQRKEDKRKKRINRRIERQNKNVKEYIEMEDDGSSKNLRKRAKLYDFDDRSKAGVINKTITKIFKTPDIYSEIQGNLAKDEFIELRKIKGDFAYVSYVNTQQRLSYGWIKLLDFSYIYID